MAWTKAKYKAWAQANHTQILSKARAWRAANVEKMRAYRQKWKRKHTKKYLTAEKKRLSRPHNVIKSKGRRAVRTAIRKGLLKRPVSCSKCHTKTSVEAHHHKGYAPSSWLKIEWLCRKCHFKADNAAYKE